MGKQTETTNLDVLAARHTATKSWAALLELTKHYTPSLYAHHGRGRAVQQENRERERLARALEAHGRTVWRGRGFGRGLVRA